MAITSPILAPPVINLTQAVMPEHGEVLHPPLPQPPPSADQVQAVEAVFSARERESQEVAGLLGLWTSMAMLNDLMIDTFADHLNRIDSEEEPEKERPKSKKQK